MACPDFSFTLCPSSKGDIVDPNLKSQFNTYKLPALVKRIFAILLKPIVSVWMRLLCVVGNLQGGEISTCREGSCPSLAVLCCFMLSA